MKMIFTLFLGSLMLLDHTAQAKVKRKTSSADQACVGLPSLGGANRAVLVGPVAENFDRALDAAGYRKQGEDVFKPYAIDSIACCENNGVAYECMIQPSNQAKDILRLKGKKAAQFGATLRPFLVNVNANMEYCSDRKQATMYLQSLNCKSTGPYNDARVCEFDTLLRAE